MKKIFLLAPLLLSSCSSRQYLLPRSPVPNLQAIGDEDFLSLLDSPGDLAVLVSQSTCAVCLTAKRHLDSYIAEKGPTIYDLDLASYRRLPTGTLDYEVETVPTLLFLRNGSVADLKTQRLDDLEYVYRLLDRLVAVADI